MSLTRRGFLQSSSLAASASLVGTSRVARAKEPAPTLSEQAAITQLAADFMREYNIPGLSFTVSAGGRPIYSHASGYADPQHTERLAPYHRFRIASVTKPITATAVLQLCERGAISLNSFLFGPRAILGDDFRIAPRHDAVRRITVEHLLTHTGGGWSNDEHDPMFMHPQLNHRELIQWSLDNQQLVGEPGSRFAYSNFGYCVLGRAIEKITGQSYASYVQQNVLTPCRIFDMRIASNTIKSRAPGEVVYFGQNGGRPYDMNVARMDSHGGWIATPMALIAFMTQIDGLNGRTPLLRPDSFSSMTTGSNVNQRYGKGIACNKVGNIWHSGSLPGTETILVRTNTGFCWAALTNTRTKRENLDAFMWDVVRKVPDWHVQD